MVKGGDGVIVNIAPVAGLSESRGRSAYGASKGGVITLSQVIAVDLRWLLHPGKRHSAGSGRDADGGSDARRCNASRLAPPNSETPGEIPAAAFLCSDDARFATGRALADDGGCQAYEIGRP